MARKVLVGDIGGTNVRFAIGMRSPDGAISLSDVLILPGDDFAEFQDALAKYLSGFDANPADEALIAVAGPVSEGRVQLTNRDWLIDASVLAARFGLERVTLVNADPCRRAGDWTRDCDAFAGICRLAGRDRRGRAHSLCPAYGPRNGAVA